MDCSDKKCINSIVYICIFILIVFNIMLFLCPIIISHFPRFCTQLCRYYILVIACKYALTITITISMNSELTRSIYRPRCQLYDLALKRELENGVHIDLLLLKKCTIKEHICNG